MIDALPPLKGPLKESDLVNRYLWMNHRIDLQWRRVRLGVLPMKDLARAYLVILRWADAIVVHDGKILIIEAKLRPEPGAIGQLEMYERLFRATPEFYTYQNWPVQLVLLTPVMDIQLVDFCASKNIMYVLFDPTGRTSTSYHGAVA